jgi:hypothetical protein
MHLVEILQIRGVPASALFLALTRRCPLSCAHCSTESSLMSEQYPDEPFRRVVGSFTAECHPRVLYMSGGEALLRAGLVHDLAVSAREVGTRSVVLSGMYFARDGHSMPAAVRRAVGSVDHFAASLDEFHEREVSRREVFRALHEIRELVPAVSLQLAGMTSDDPYLLGLIDDIRREFDDEVPMFVDLVGRAGRAKEWMPAPEPTGRGTPRPDVLEPCFLTSWPLVHYDGTVFACCAQEIVARRRPEHLVIGNAARDPWPVLAARSVNSRMLHGIRLFGPLELRRRLGDGEPGTGYCDACVRLGDDPGLAAAVDRYFSSPGGRALAMAAQEMVAGADPGRFVSMYGAPNHENLVRLGWRDPACAG